MKILSKSEIVHSFGKDFYDDEYNGAMFNLSKIRKVYGKNVHPLTLTLAKQLVGKTVYGLEGQDWFAESTSEKTKSLQKLKILGFSEEPNDFRHVNEKYVKNDNVVIRSYRFKNTFGAYLYKSQFCTGSGCDYIYVFIEK